MNEWSDIDGRFGVVSVLDFGGVEGAELENKVFNLQFDLCSDPHLWSWAPGQVFWLCFTGRRPQRRPSTLERLCLSLGTPRGPPSEELEKKVWAGLKKNLVTLLLISNQSLCFLLLMFHTINAEFLFSLAQQLKKPLTCWPHVQTVEEEHERKTKFTKKKSIEHNYANIYSHVATNPQTFYSLKMIKRLLVVLILGPECI